MKVWFGDEVKRRYLEDQQRDKGVAVAGDPAAPAVAWGPGRSAGWATSRGPLPGRRCLALGRCRVQLRAGFRFLAHHCQARCAQAAIPGLPGAAGAWGRRGRLVVEIKGYHLPQQRSANSGGNYVRNTLMKNLKELKVQLPTRGGAHESLP